MRKLNRKLIDEVLAVMVDADESKFEEIALKYPEIKLESFRAIVWKLCAELVDPDNIWCKWRTFLDKSCEKKI